MLAAVIITTGQCTNDRPIKAPAPLARSAVIVDIDLGKLRGTRNQEIDLPLPGAAGVIKAVGIRIERAGKGFVWIGELANQKRSQVILSVQGDYLSGSVRTEAGGIYDIHSTDGGRFLVRELDPRSFPKDDVNSGPSSAELGPFPALGNPCGGTDFGNMIDVLIGYTSAAANSCGSQAALESEIYGGVAEANQAFANTGMSQRLNIVGLNQVADAETGDSCKDLGLLHTGTDGTFDDLFALRDTHGADAVVLVVSHPLKSTSAVDTISGLRTGCNGTTTTVKGEAYGVLNPNDLRWAPHAFAVIDERFVGTQYTLAHELGHLLGARHQFGDDDTKKSPFDDNHGFINTTCNERSVMATDTTGATSRVAYWSNRASLPCSPFGSQTENNARAISESAPVVANFRCSSPDRTDVWMRDTWNDTGVEPNASREPVWTSPYIWVRRTRDVNLVEQHRDERPDLNSSVYVYVKVHNGGSSTANGKLELSFADSGTGLAFPSSLIWTPIGTQQLQIPARDTRIFEFPWTTPASTPSGSGHFVFLARWISTTDPISYGGPDVEKMARESNNVVLRNFAMVENRMHGAPGAVVMVRNLRKFDDRFPAGPITIRIAPPANEINGSFFYYGKAFITLGPEIAKSWVEAGSPGSGLVKEGTRYRINAPEGALLTKIAIADEDSIGIDFERTPSTPARAFHVEVTQQLGEKVVGGITYELPPP